MSATFPPGLDPRVATAFYGRFQKLRESQLAAVAPLLAGKNLLLTSATGSGKTEAVVVPVVSRYWRAAVAHPSTFLVYVSPTKALVNDLEKRLGPPLHSLGLTVGVRHGDRDDLLNSRSPHVLVTTPESLDVLLHRKDAALGSIQCVIVDEVHLLYNTQRGLQLSILLQRLRLGLGRAFQWVALSATVARLSDVREFFGSRADDTALLSFPTTRPIDAQIRHVGTLQAMVDLIQKPTRDRETKLLVFANSRRDCERVAGGLLHDDVLKSAVRTHYSSLSPEVRLDTEHRFATMRTAICVATSTLELGIDIGDIDAVVLWGVPGGLESFLQRIGRGCRRSKKTNVICLVPDDSPIPELDALRFCWLLAAARNGELQGRQPYELYGAVAQQCLSLISAEGGRFTRVADLCRLVEHHPHLSRDVVENILSQLASAGFLQHHGAKNRYGADIGLHRLEDLRLIFGNFAIGSQDVDVLHESKKLGTVPAVNLLRIGTGSIVRFAGACWRVRLATPEGVRLTPVAQSHDAVDFAYGGRGIPWDPQIVDGVWRMIHSGSVPVDSLSQGLRPVVARFVESVRKVSTERQIPFIRTTQGISYFTFAGRLVNRAIALHAGKHNFEADDLRLRVLSDIDWSQLPTEPNQFGEAVHRLYEESPDQSIYQQSLPLDLQEREFLQPWLRDSAIRTILTRLAASTPVRVERLANLQQSPRY